MHTTILRAGFMAIGLFLSGACAQAPTAGDAKLPIREVTVFKDGHAFVMSEADVAVQTDGRITLDRLPTPILGTFWPYSATPNAKLTSVVAGRRRVEVNRTAIDLRALVEANIGAEVIISEKTDKDPARFAATILSVPTRSTRELDITDPSENTDRLPLKAGFFLAKVQDGVRTVHFDRVLDVTFRGDVKPGSTAEEIRNSLALRLNFEGAVPEKARVGIMYLQHGLRWIPAYKVDIDGKGEATIKLEATLVNDLADLDGASVNLVVGVPKFDFKDTLDPMSLQDTLARMSSQAQPAQYLSNAFSNSIMTQVAADGYDRRAAQPTPEDPNVTGAGRAEDLFVYNIANVTLRRGERMVIPVAEFRLKYEDIYTLDLPQTPPIDVSMQFNSNQQSELAKQLALPKAHHKLRLTNSSAWPLTTAPALIMSENRPIAQGMMTYTAIGAKVDLEVTTAVEVSTKHSERETGRTPNAAQWQRNALMKVDLDGSVNLTNRSPKSITVEVTRMVCGSVNTASHGGTVEQLSGLSDWDAVASSPRPTWWNWYGWPSWWSYMNGIGRIRWTITLPAGNSTELRYTSHYFWN